MYFIKKIALDNKQNYSESKIVDHSYSIALALSLLEDAVKTFVKEELGRQAAEQIKILDIKDLQQVSEPIMDGMLAYRLHDNPHRVHIFQRKTLVVKSKNWTWGTTDTLVPQFRLTHIFELEEYEKLNATSTESKNINPVPVVAVARSRSAPVGFNFVEQLKRNPRFKARFLISQQSQKKKSSDQLESISESGEQELQAEPKLTVPVEKMDTEPIVCTMVSDENQ